MQPQSQTHIKIHIDSHYKDLGIEHVVYAELHGINNQSVNDAAVDLLIEKAKQKALLVDELALETNSILEGYRQMTITLGRSIKKFPPSALALIKTIQRTQNFPRINPFVDIYNAEVVNSMLSIGAHDLSKVHGDIYFRISTGDEPFTAIGGDEKLTSKGDMVYADDHNILAWLNTRDSEFAKITPDTTDAILMIQGNPKTTLDHRQQVLEKVCHQIVQLCGGKYQVRYISINTTI